MPSQSPPSLVQRIHDCSEWRWQELELGTYDEVKEAAEWISTLQRTDPNHAWQLEWYLVRADLWYLVRYVSSMGRWLEDGSSGVVQEKWLYDRCRELEVKCNGVVDIWSRFHWKSYLKTVLKQIQEALRDLNVTIVTFSHTRPIAKQFLSGIQREIQTNEHLQTLSWDPTVDWHLFGPQKKDYVRDSLNDGIILRRSSNPKESTFSAFGLVDSLPTSGHWQVRNLDDAVTKDSVTTPEQIAKVLNAWELSIPLGMPAGRNDEWCSGTFYALQDLYHSMIYDRGYELRLHPCYVVDWERTERDDRDRIHRLRLFLDGDPVLYEKGKIGEFETQMGRDEGTKNVAMQLYCDPNAGAGGRKFEKEWLTFYDPDKRREYMRDGDVLILCDSAGERSNTSDFTSYWTVSLRADGVAYVVDIVRDRLSLTQRATALLRMHHRARSSFYECRYERYGAMSDIEHIQYVLKEKDRRMKIVRVGGLTDKDSRIERLIPWFENARLALPKKFMYRTATGDRVDLIEQFIYDEYLPFPAGTFKDMLDSLSRIADTEGKITIGANEGKKIPLTLRWPGDPEMEKEPKTRGDYYRPKKKRRRGGISASERWLVA